MRKLLVALVSAGCLLGVGSSGASAAVRAAPVWAGSCGVPQASPVWVDYGTPDLRALLGKPGMVVATSTGALPAQLRAAGASTVYIDLYLKSRVGRPSAPADPATIVDKANKFYDFVVQRMGCATPTIVENELFGASLVTPWSDTNTQYRQNVFAFLQQLAARGAHPVLLVNSTPYTGGDAASWWQGVSNVADIVREDYVPATLVWGQGVIVGNRTLREKYRTSIEDLTSIGIAPQRLGIMVSFATTPGLGGRNGLQPTSAWLQVAKWQALAAKEVAAETGIGSVWSWGWATFTAAERDPNKPLAACVWLWARSSSLCDAPSTVGANFDPSLTEGQITLGAGTQCTVGDRSLSLGAIQALQRLTGDRETAFSALYARLVESSYEQVSTATVLLAERAVITAHFGGSRSAYLAAIAKAHTTLQIARGVLSDEVRQARVEAQLSAPAPSANAVRTFYSSYPELLVRKVKTKPGAPWLDGHSSGMILSATAPSPLFQGGVRTVWTPQGLIRVEPLGDPVPLGSVPLSRARPAIAAALRSFARGAAFEQWTVARQKAALATVVCAQDDLPEPAAIELTMYLPFLQL